MIRLVSFFFAGGDAFFWGLACLAFGAAVALWRERRRLGAVSRLAIFIGWTIVAVSATPLPMWFYAAGILATAFVLLSPRVAKTRFLPPRWFSLPVSVCLVLLWCAAGAAWESLYRLPPELDTRTPARALVVIGDSISAGLLGPSERTWPKQFRERYSMQVVDLSCEGATSRSAIKQAQQLDAQYPDLDAVVVVEIGGNDYFELRPPADFEADLDRLLMLLDRPNRQVVMLELPLPPFYNAYGRVQRRLAARHRIPLVSKRKFADVVFSPGATLDTVHLSESGHRLMAEMVWRQVGRLLR
jgi:acyl-CoA thioesterase-1